MSWILSVSYNFDREEIGNVIEALLRSHDLVFENTETNHRALASYRDGSSVDFADTMVVETSGSPWIRPNKFRWQFLMLTLHDLTDKLIDKMHYK
ncbi:MAG: hypothetical protein OXE92_00215 [Bacteroidetes bacterium]|nr:hypothetical protein [Bacteroidota bacterium]